MSYESRNELPVGTSLQRVKELIDLLGYNKIKDNLKTPNMIASYYWLDRKDYKSWTGIELTVHKEDRQIYIHTRSRVSRSYWDLVHQNKTIKMLRDVFGGYFDTDAGRNKYWRPEHPPPKPIVSGCYLSRWIFKNSMGKIHVYRNARILNGQLSGGHPSGFIWLDDMNPRLLSNNLIIPFAIAVWEEYFRSTFAALLKYAGRREHVSKRAKLGHSQLEQIAAKKQDVEITIAECFSFQRPSVICENFRLIDSGLDLAAAMKKPFRRRKVNLFDRIEMLVENRNAFVH